MKNVNIIVPIFNEEDNIIPFVRRINTVMNDLPYQYTLTFVDDGSSDSSLATLRNLAELDSHISYVSLSRNFGHQNALKAGFDKATGACIITMDGDLQHPAELIPQMLEKFEEGYDIVYTIRNDCKKLSFFKRKTSDIFYRLLNVLSDVKVERGCADFRLVSSPVANVLKDLTENDFFFRGLVKWSGFKQVSLPYDVAVRNNGKTKYTLTKMVKLGVLGILSFSTRPLYFAVCLGFVLAVLSTLYLPYALISYYFGHTISGWTSIIVTIAFFGGMQLIVMGIIGLYIGRIFMQVKNRPSYIIKESANLCKENISFF